MLSSFRRLSKSAIGTSIIGIVGLLILIGFAMGDIQSLSLGGGGLSSSTLAEAGSLEVTDNDISSAMQRQLANVRQQNPEATYSDLADDFGPILQSLIDARALEAFAQKHGLVVSKRLVDAEIANIPGVKGLNGQVSTEAYQAFLARQRMTDAEVRNLVMATLLQRMILTPAASNAQVPIGIATPYASMLLEERQGAVALVPLSAFTSGLDPSGQQIQQYYTANRDRYIVPEQRVLRLAKIGPDQVAAVAASPQEIAAYYNSHQDVYGAKDVREISQAVVPDQNVAKQIAERARGGQGFVEAVKPAGLGAADVSVGSQTKEQFADLAGAKVAAAAFAAKTGEILGPIQSPLGWHVVKIESATTKAGKSLDQARDEIARQITDTKRQEALADLVDKVQDVIDGGGNFEEAAKAGGLQVMKTPLITGSGTARGDLSYQFPADLVSALKTGFELAPSDEPVIEQNSDGSAFVLVAPADVIAAAPAPLASIKERVKADWIKAQASQQARALADSIAAKATGKTSLADAVKQANKPLPPVEPARAQRIQLSEMGGEVPAPLRTLFNMTEGKAKVGIDPQGRGYFVVKVDKIIPGNALNQPRLIAQVQNQFGEPLAQEYALQFLNAVKKDVGVERNEPVIEATRKRITGGAI
ncbi:MAG TPA: peptidyl-prolyl cis-trans isomerase [Sphingomicrobium sp.]|nr:peptidyl-prolyl cis-trans isomerase [Sphingomicrobium sp.]